MPRVVVTGRGIVSPLGLGCAATEEALRAERTAFREVRAFDVSAQVAKTAGLVEVPERGLFSHLSRRHEARVDRGTKMLLLAVREAIAESRLRAETVDAIVIGTSAGAMEMGELFTRRSRVSMRRAMGQTSLVENYQPHRQMVTLTKEIGWQGTPLLVSNACASGANALGVAMQMIRCGKAQRVIAGGYDAVSELVFVGFDSLRALAPSGIPRPFDAARDGLCLGEGAGVLVVETEASAAERGAEALAVLSGYHTATDLHHLTQPDPAGKTAARCMERACHMAQITAREVDYLNAHGTGTPHNDVAESAAISAWAGPDAAQVKVSSTKSAMGHLLGGAGAVEAVICVQALLAQWVPASLHVRQVDPAVTFDLVRAFGPARLRHVLSNSFGFGGTNASLVFSAL